MKQVLHPVPIACLLMAIGGAVMANVPFMVLALLCGIASVGFLSARTAQSGRALDPSESLGNEGRALIKPVQRLATDIEEIVKTNQASPSITVIGGEALAESSRLLNQVARSLTTRDELIRSARGRHEAEKELGQARMRLEFSQGEERTSLEAAIAARTSEISHYDEIGTHVKRIELGVHQAEAALAEMKARLSLSVSSDKAELDTGDDLRETLGRLKTLSKSYDEVDQIVRG